MVSENEHYRIFAIICSSIVSRHASPLTLLCTILDIEGTVFIRLNAALNQTPQMEAKLSINAPPNQKNVAFTRG